MGEAKDRADKIAQAMTGECCGNCKFGLDAGPHMTCRRYPPQALPMVMQIRADPKVGGGVNEVVSVGSHFPNMAKDGYCGEFRIRLIGLN